MKAIITKILFLFMCLFLWSCSASRIVKPLDEKENQVGLSIGGPFLQTDDFEAFPGFYPYLYFARGITDNLTFIGGYHLFQLTHIEFGLLANIYHSENLKLGFSAGPALHVIPFAGDDSTIFPSLELNFYTYQYDNTLFYFGAKTFLDSSLSQKPNLGDKYNLLVIPNAGFVFGNNKWRFCLEAKLYNDAFKDDYFPLNTSKIRGLENLGVFVGVGYRFGSSNNGE